MRRLFWLMPCLAVVTTSPATAQPLYRESHALVIGIDRYAHRSSLSYARSDAAAVAELLMNQGFEVRTLYDEHATKEAILSEFYALARQLQDEDRVLIFFAGHGETEDLGGEAWGYIVPYDSQDSATYLSMDELQTQSLKMGAARHQLFVMDACYGGMLGIVRSAKSLVQPTYVNDVAYRQARQMLAAGGKNQTVLDVGPDGHSYFTSAFLRGIREGGADHDSDGWITASELASYLTSAAWNRYQTPMLASLPRHEGGEFLFRSPKGSNPTPLKDPPVEAGKTRKDRGESPPVLPPPEVVVVSVPVIYETDFADFFSHSGIRPAQCLGSPGIAFLITAVDSFRTSSLNLQAVFFDADRGAIDRTTFDSRNFEKSVTDWTPGQSTRACLPVPEGTVSIEFESVHVTLG